MIHRDYYITRKDGVKLYIVYSDKDLIIKQLDTGILYSTAIDIESSPHTYEETTRLIDGEEPL